MIAKINDFSQCVTNIVISIQLYAVSQLALITLQKPRAWAQKTVAWKNCLLAGRNLRQDHAYIVWGGGGGGNIAYGWMSTYINASLSEHKHISICYRKIVFVMGILNEI